MGHQTITTDVRTEGFEGILYPGNGRKDKVLIVMSGSNGGMRLTRQAARFYHENGFPALALALFRTRQTPKDLSRVPVEYVENAIAWRVSFMPPLEPDITISTLSFRPFPGYRIPSNPSVCTFADFV